MSNQSTVQAQAQRATVAQFNIDPMTHPAAADLFCVMLRKDGFTAYLEGKDRELVLFTNATLGQIALACGEALWVKPAAVIDLTDPRNSHFIKGGYVSYRTQWGVASFPVKVMAGEPGGFWGGQHFKVDEFHARTRFDDGAELISGEEASK